MGMVKLLNRSAWFVLLSLGAGTAHSILVPVKVLREEAAPTVLEMPQNTTESESSDDPGESSPAVVAPVDDPEPEGAASQGDEIIDEGPLVLGSDVDLETARRAFDTGLVTFVDARTVEEYEAGHIESAIHLSPQLFDKLGIPPAIEFMDTTMPVIVYCVGGPCTDSDAVVFALEGLGFESLHVFKAGYPAWVEAGLPTETGPDPLGEVFGGP